MTQASRPTGQNIANFPAGDSGPYSSGQWRALFAALFTQSPTTQGPLINWLNELAVTSSAANSISVASGAAMVNGNLLLNDAAVAFTVPSAPAGATRTDYVVATLNDTGTPYSTGLTFPTVLTDYAGEAAIPTYACRLAILRGTPGGGTPTLIQSGETFMVPLATYIINDAGTISSLIDRRAFCVFSSAYAKTRGFLLPYAGQYRSSTGGGTPDRYTGGYSTEFGASLFRIFERTSAYAGLSVPDDFLSGLTATILLNSSGPGDYRFAAWVRYGGIGEAWDTHGHTWSENTWSDVGVNGTLVEVHTFSLTHASIGDIVSLNFRRNATHAEDTGAHFIQSPGWWIEYTARPGV